MLIRADRLRSDCVMCIYGFERIWRGNNDTSGFNSMVKSSSFAQSSSRSKALGRCAIINSWQYKISLSALSYMEICGCVCVLPFSIRGTVFFNIMPLAEESDYQSTSKRSTDTTSDTFLASFSFHAPAEGINNNFVTYMLTHTLAVLFGWEVWLTLLNPL